MMKLSSRFLAVLLAFSLVAETLPAAAFSSPISCHPSLGLFSIQALAPEPESIAVPGSIITISVDRNAASLTPMPSPKSFFGSNNGWPLVINALSEIRERTPHRYNFIRSQLRSFVQARLPGDMAAMANSVIDALGNALTPDEIAGAIEPILWNYEFVYELLSHVSDSLHSASVVDGPSVTIQHMFPGMQGLANAFVQADEDIAHILPGTQLHHRFLATWSSSPETAKSFENLMFVTEDQYNDVHIIWHQQALEKIQRLSQGGNRVSAILAVMLHGYLLYQGRTHDEVLELGFGEEDIPALAQLTPVELARKYTQAVVHRSSAHVHEGPNSAARYFLEWQANVRNWVDSNQDIAEEYGYASLEEFYWQVRPPTGGPMENQLLQATNALRKRFGKDFLEYWPTFINLARSAGIQNADALLLYALPALSPQIHSAADLNRVGAQLLRLMVETGYNARAILAHAVPLLAGMTNTPEEFERLISDLIEMSAASGGNSDLLFSMGLQNAADIFGKDFNRRWPDIKRFVVHLKIGSFFIKELPRLKEEMDHQEFSKHLDELLHLVEVTGNQNAGLLRVQGRKTFGNQLDVHWNELLKVAEQMGSKVEDLWRTVIPLYHIRFGARFEEQWPWAVRWMMVSGPNTIFLLRHRLTGDLNQKNQLVTLDRLEKAKRVSGLHPFESVREFVARMAFDYLEFGIPLEDLADFINFGLNPKDNLKYVITLFPNSGWPKVIERLNRQGHISTEDLLSLGSWTPSPIGPAAVLQDPAKLTDEALLDLVQRMNDLDIRLEEHLRNHHHPILIGAEFETLWSELPFGYDALHLVGGDVRDNVVEIKTKAYANPEIIRKLQRGTGLALQVGVHRTVENQGISEQDHTLIELLGHLYELASIESQPVVGSGRQYAGVWGWGKKIKWNYKSNVGLNLEGVVHTSDWNIRGNPWIYKTLMDYASTNPEGWARDKALLMRQLRAIKNDDVQFANLLAPWSGLGDFIAFLERTGLNIGREPAVWKYAENPTATQSYILGKSGHGDVKIHTDPATHKISVTIENGRLKETIQHFNRAKTAFEYANELLRADESSRATQVAATKLTELLGTEDAGSEMVGFIEKLRVINLDRQITISLRKDLSKDKKIEELVEIPAYQYTALKNLRKIIGQENGSRISNLLQIIMERAAVTMFPDDAALQNYAVSRGWAAIEDAKLGGLTTEGAERTGSIFPVAIVGRQAKKLTDEGELARTPRGRVALLTPLRDAGWVRTADFVESATLYLGWLAFGLSSLAMLGSNSSPTAHLVALLGTAAIGMVVLPSLAAVSHALGDGYVEVIGEDGQPHREKFEFKKHFWGLYKGFVLYSIPALAFVAAILIPGVRLLTVVVWGAVALATTHFVHSYYWNDHYVFQHAGVARGMVGVANPLASEHVERRARADYRHIEDFVTTNLQNPFTIATVLLYLQGEIAQEELLGMDSNAMGLLKRQAARADGSAKLLGYQSFIELAYLAKADGAHADLERIDFASYDSILEELLRGQGIPEAEIQSILAYNSLGRNPQRPRMAGPTKEFLRHLAIMLGYKASSSTLEAQDVMLDDLHEMRYSIPQQYPFSDEPKQDQRWPPYLQTRGLPSVAKSVLPFVGNVVSENERSRVITNPAVYRRALNKSQYLTSHPLDGPAWIENGELALKIWVVQEKIFIQRYRISSGALRLLDAKPINLAAYLTQKNIPFSNKGFSEQWLIGEDSIGDTYHSSSASAIKLRVIPENGDEVHPNDKKFSIGLEINGTFDGREVRLYGWTDRGQTPLPPALDIIPESVSTPGDQTPGSRDATIDVGLPLHAGLESPSDDVSGRMEVNITERQKNILESIQKRTEAYLTFLYSHQAMSQQAVAEVIARYWADIQKLEFFALPVPMQQVIIDGFASNANPIVVKHDLLTYHDAADGRMEMALFSIVERRPLDSPQGSWAYGVRRLWGKRRNSQQAFDSHIDGNVIYDLDAVDEFIDPIIHANRESRTLTDPSKSERTLEALNDWFYTLGFVRMEIDKIKETYIAFSIAHEYAHLQRQLAVPYVNLEYEELLAELFSLATVSPFIAFARLIQWADQGLLRGTLFLSTVFNSNKKGEWIKQLADISANLYANAAAIDTQEHQFSQVAISLVHQIEDQLPGGRVLRPESHSPRFNAAYTQDLLKAS